MTYGTDFIWTARRRAPASIRSVASFFVLSLLEPEIPYKHAMHIWLVPSPVGIIISSHLPVCFKKLVLESFSLVMSVALIVFLTRMAARLPWAVRPSIDKLVGEEKNILYPASAACARNSDTFVSARSTSCIHTMGTLLRSAAARFEYRPRMFLDMMHIFSLPSLSPGPGWDSMPWATRTGPGSMCRHLNCLWVFVRCIQVSLIFFL